MTEATAKNFFEFMSSLTPEQMEQLEKKLPLLPEALNRLLAEKEQ